MSRTGLSILAVGLRYPPYVAGGYELLTRDAVEGLRERGHAVRVLCGAGERFDDGSVLPWLRPELDGEVDLFQRSFDASNAERFRLHFLSLANYRATLRALDATPTELVLFFNLSHVSLGPVLAARHAGVPTLGYVADPWPENHWVRAWRETAAEGGGKSLRLAALTRAWAIFRDLVDLGPLCASSADLARALGRDGIAPSKLEVLHLGLPPDMARRLAQAGAAGQSHGRPSDAPLRVACTSMQWHGKGQHVLLEAAARARAAGAQIEVHLAGTGEPDYVARLRDAAADPRLAGAVRFAGLLERDGVGRLLAESHAFCMPSLWGEPFGLATLEAMAHGLPAVVTDAGASPEIVADGVEGRVVRAGDADDLADALVGLASDEARRVELGRAARERVARDFTHAGFLDGLERAALRIAGGAGA